MYESRNIKEEGSTDATQIFPRMKARRKPSDLLTSCAVKVLCRKIEDVRCSKNGYLLLLKPPGA